MRKVILAVGLSLDGYIARPDGAIDFLFMPKDCSMASLFAAVDTAIMGRKSLEAGLKMGGGSLPNTHMMVYVFSRSQLPGEKDGFTYVNESPASFVTKLRKRRGKDIWLMAGNSLANSSKPISSMNFILGLFPYCLEEASRFSRADFPNAISL
jgi:dihydrofolate reductase